MDADPPTPVVATLLAAIGAGATLFALRSAPRAVLDPFRVALGTPITPLTLLVAQLAASVAVGLGLAGAVVRYGG